MSIRATAFAKNRLIFFQKKKCKNFTFEDVGYQLIAIIRFIIKFSPAAFNFKGNEGEVRSLGF